MAKIYGAIGASALMTFDKSFSRSNGQPLDSTEVFYSYDAAVTYAASEVAYVGQKIVVVETINEVTTVTHYGIEPDNSLKELGTTPIGDEKSIVVAEDGTISLKGVTGLTFTETSSEGEEVAINYQPLMTKDGIVWVRPSATTVEGLASEIEGLKTRLGILEQDAHIHDNKDVLDGISAEKVTAWDAKVDSVAAGNNSVTIGGTDADPTVAVKLSAAENNAIELVEDGLKVVIPDAAEYTIVKAAESGDYAAIYNLTKNGEIVGASINIPKDMVVQSGAVIENPEGQPAGTYIELVLQNVETPLYINVGDLIEYVTSGSAEGDMVVVAVSDDHKVTATITDGAITLAKLSTEVQTAIGKAHEHANATVLDGITSEKVTAWDASEQNAKDYADGLNEAMDGRVGALEQVEAEKNVINSVDETYFEIGADRKVTLKDLVVGKVTGLQDALDGKADKGTTLAAYGITDAYTKEETLNKIEEKITEINGGESAGEVLSQLNSYKEINDAAVEAIQTKLNTVESNAQVNVIDAVSDEFEISADTKTLVVKEIAQSKVTGLIASLEAKADKEAGKSLVSDTLIAKLERIGIATADTAGLVKSSAVENGVVVAEDGSMSVHSVNLSKIVQTEGDLLVLDGGSSASV